MNPRPTVLVVEDQPSERRAMSRLLRMERYEVLTARDAQEALGYLRQPVRLVISDLRLGTISGVDLLRQWKAQRPETPFLLVTAYGDVDSAVSAMKFGAADYLTKPVDPDQLLRLAGELSRRGDGDGNLAPCEADGHDFPGFALGRIIGESAAMRQVYERVSRAAQTESIVLILGESGTGKELVAEAIHRASRRARGPFVAVNITAVPESLVESELFGHVQGAFTGAAGNRTGRFEAAAGGTLFIDEIGDSSVAVQAKLLRVLETLRITPVGGNHERAADVRVVAATSRDLHGAVADGDFREDLYYRLNVLTIQLPPLRDRRDDIPLLVDHFLDESCRANGRKRPTVSAELERFLLQFDWPGNVRQLRNAIESMVVMASGEVLSMGDVPSHLTRVRATTAQEGDATTLESLERAAVLEALARTGGNRTHAAEALGISVRTLQRKLKLWGGDAGEDAEDAL
ncbi:MAG TPA: sigma-54 dependent transcriptional regulator [Pirellulales bacterium]|nr:sigma-54 dependent transcriptional regulator [Pirellulales bacterium]